MIRIPNSLFFEEVEAILAEGREVRIRMRGNSMLPLLRSHPDTVVLTPIAAYGAAAAQAAPGSAAAGRPEAGEKHGTGLEALRAGDIVLFRHRGRHILHRIVRIERDTPQPSAEANSGTSGWDAQPTASTASQAPVSDGAPRAEHGTRRAGEQTDTPEPPYAFRFTLAGDGNYRTTERCTGSEICAVVTRIVRPSGHIVDTASPGWQRRSRLWLSIPAPLRRISLRALHLLRIL